MSARPGRSSRCPRAPGARAVSTGSGSTTTPSWIWKKIYRIEQAAAALEPRLARLDRRLLRQFYREKFLLESSDWPFLISTWSARDYAENRAAEHFERALTLAGWLEAGRALGPAEEALLRDFETEDHLFEEVVLPDGTVI